MKDLSADFWKRFASKYKVNDNGCWIWFGAKGRGYGVISFDGKGRVAHRLAYELLHGPVPKGLELDHVCKNGLCVNPAHLEPVTHSENCRRGLHSDILKKRAALISHCPRGHEYAGDNLYLTPEGHRECRKCNRIAGKKYRESHGLIKRTNIRFYEYKGQKKRLRELADEKGMPVKQLRYRIEIEKMTVEAAMEKPYRKRK